MDLLNGIFLGEDGRAKPESDLEYSMAYEIYRARQHPLFGAFAKQNEEAVGGPGEEWLFGNAEEDPLADLSDFARFIQTHTGGWIKQKERESE